MNGPSRGSQPDPADKIDAYLDELLLALRGRPREARRLLAEVESHLRQAVETRVAAGLGTADATEQALKAFGPPSAVARGLPPQAAYRSLVGQLTEAVLVVISMLSLAVGVAAVPAAVIGLTANPALVTGDQPGLAPGPGRCQQLLHMIAAPSCRQALVVHHLEEVIRSHLFSGWFGILVLATWWVVHVQRKARPTVLPVGFALTVAGTLLGALSLFMLAVGIPDVVRGVTSIGHIIGSGDLVATGATLMAASLLCWTVLARQATHPARALQP
ncbi:MAG: hypothetical protein J2P28_19920 [Actinobacteria bacterium]|nr:hypothetical protein [Actinomycetota bacterium]MBO0837761.1 hypothetical protein [Actinomycetota bacterium]